MNRRNLDSGMLGHWMIFFLVAVLSVPSSVFGGCGDNAPAFPVPEMRGSTTLWPPSGFRPGNPGAQLPQERDSTDYISTSIPGRASGHELFQSLDIANNTLYVAYNAGLQVWNISGANAESPLRVAAKDGWSGEFMHFPSPGEASNFIEDIAARETTGGDVLIVVSGLDQVGTSLWRHTPSNSLTQISQHTDRVTNQVRMGAVGTTVYAFGAGSDNGVSVFNAAAGNHLGSLAGDTSSKRYIDTLERDGKIFVAAANGNSIRMKIWEVANPASPATAIQRYDGESLGSGVKGVALFEKSGTAYLALVKSHTIFIYNVNNCLDSNGCTSLGSAVWQFALPGPWPSFEYLTYSIGPGNDPFLYYGMETSTVDGTKKEMLFNLSTLGTTNSITEITAGGGVYSDGCGNQVDYWGDYYDGNEHGYRNFHPRIGKWKDNVFYRATNATLDTHVLGEAPELNPIMTTTLTSGGPHWMSTPGFQHSIFFSAVEENCSGAGTWTWNDNDALSVVSGTGSTGTLVSDVCASSDCPNRTVEVWAVKDLCSGDPDLQINTAQVTVEEPRAQIRGVETSPIGNPPGEFPVCTQLELSADLDGRSPFTYAWTITRDDSGQTVATGSGATLNWDTTGEAIDPPIFTDGFESGDVSAWSSTVPLSEIVHRPFGGPEGGGPEGGSATYTVDLSVTNLSATHQTSTQTSLVLVSLGDLGFDPTEAITVTDQGGGQFLLQANTLNATEWRWVVENDAGGNDIFDWGSEDDTLVYQWSAEGTRAVTVFARNCEAPEISAMTDVEIVDPNPLEMTNFEPIEGAICNLNFQQVWDCLVNQAIPFTVSANGSPTSYEFDWDNDGTVDQTIGVGGPFTHTYTTLGQKTASVRAKKGAELSAWRSVTFQVVNSL